MTIRLHYPITDKIYQCKYTTVVYTSPVQLVGQPEPMHIWPGMVIVLLSFCSKVRWWSLLGRQVSLKVF